jgi:hypothetical protein
MYRLNTWCLSIIPLRLVRYCTTLFLAWTIVITCWLFCCRHRRSFTWELLGSITLGWRTSRHSHWKCTPVSTQLVLARLPLLSVTPMPYQCCSLSYDRRARRAGWCFGLECRCAMYILFPVTRNSVWDKMFGWDFTHVLKYHRWMVRARWTCCSGYMLDRVLLCTMWYTAPLLLAGVRNGHHIVGTRFCEYSEVGEHRE